MQSTKTITNLTNGSINNSDTNDTKKIKISEIWKVLDEEIGGNIPNYLKQLLTCGGYDSIVVLEFLNADEIIEIENYGKNKFLFDLKDEDEINDFLNMCSGTNPKNFEIKRGHKLLLQSLARRINAKGVDYFIEQLKSVNKSNISKYRLPTFGQNRSELKYPRKRLRSDVENSNNNMDDGSELQFEPMVTIKEKRFSDIDNDDDNSCYEYENSDPLKSDMSPTSQQSPTIDYTKEKLAEHAEGLKILANTWIEKRLACEDVSKYLVTNTKVIAKNGLLEGFIQCVCGTFIKVQHVVRHGHYQWITSNFTRHVAKHELPTKKFQ